MELIGDEVEVEGIDHGVLLAIARIEWARMEREAPREWSMVPIVWEGKPAAHARALYPTCLQWAESLDARKAFWSILPAGHVIHRHVDGPGERFHFPVHVPEGIVGGQIGERQVRHAEGIGYSFDATVPHAFWNLESKAPRVMLVAEAPPLAGRTRMH